MKLYLSGNSHSIDNIKSVLLKNLTNYEDVGKGTLKIKFPSTQELYIRNLAKQYNLNVSANYTTKSSKKSKNVPNVPNVPNNSVRIIPTISTNNTISNNNAISTNNTSSNNQETYHVSLKQVPEPIQISEPVQVAVNLSEPEPVPEIESVHVAVNLPEPVPEIGTEIETESVFPNVQFSCSHIISQQSNVSTSTGNTTNLISMRNNFPNSPPNKQPISVAIISLGGSYSNSDALKYWVTCLGRSPESYPNIIDHVDFINRESNINENGNDDENENIENALNIQLTMGMSYGQIHIYHSNNNPHDYLNTLKQVIADGHKVVSMPWTVKESVLRDVCDQFESVLSTAKNTGKVLFCSTYDFPALSPSVVSCLDTENKIEFQLVSEFLPDTLKYRQTKTNNPMRVIPDILIPSNEGYTIVYNDQIMVNWVSGCSCASAIFAGYMARLSTDVRKVLYNNIQTLLYEKGVYKGVVNNSLFTTKINDMNLTGLGIPRNLSTLFL